MRSLHLERPVDRRGYLPSHAEPNPTAPEFLRDFRFFAIVKTWMDEDVIEGAVRNALCQGAERVFVVDNAEHRRHRGAGGSGRRRGG